MSEAIQGKILNKYRRCKKPDKQAQKAERLLHDKKFVGDVERALVHFGPDFFKLRRLSDAKLAKIIKNNPLLKYKPPGADYELKLSGYTGPEPTDLKGKIAKQYRLLELMRLRWREFCGDRHIDDGWDGDIASLARYIDPPIKIYTKDMPFIGKKKIIIELDERATEKAVRGRWSEVERFQNEFLSGKAEGKPNFGRDLCWYGLKQSGLTIGAIAQLWLKEFREEVELLGFGGFKKAHLAAIKDALKEKLSDRALDGFPLIKEIKAGNLTEDLRQLFEGEMDQYAPKLNINGTAKKRSKTPHRDSSVRKEAKSFGPFEEVINKAVSRMEEELGKPWKYPETKFPFSIEKHKSPDK